MDERGEKEMSEKTLTKGGRGRKRRKDMNKR